MGQWPAPAGAKRGAPPIQTSMQRWTLFVIQPRPYRAEGSLVFPFHPWNSHPLMSIFDQTAEQYGTATVKTLRYMYRGGYSKPWYRDPGVETPIGTPQGSRRKSRKGEYNMMEETAAQGHEGHGSGCQCGCGSKSPTKVAVDEKAAKEQLAREEAIRARNKSVRAPSTVPGPDSPPPFSDHSGSL